MNWDLGVHLLQVLLGLALALLVFATGPGRPVNRYLGMLLVVEVAIVGGFRLYEYAPPGIDRGLTGIKNFGLAIGWQTYLLFLAAALDTPLLRPFQTRVARGLLWASMAFFLAVFFARPDLYSTYSRTADGRLVMTAGPLDLLLNFLAAVVFLYALVVSISAYRRAPVGTVAKRRAKAFVIAFGIRDAILGPALLLVSNPLFRPNYIAFEASAPGDPIVWAAIVYYPLVAYGILKWQLFGIELQVKRTLQHGLVPTMLIVAFFVATEVAQEVLADRFQSALIGILGAALVALFFLPLQRMAEKVAHQAMPRVAETNEYHTYRRLELYRAALEGAGRDGRVTQRERAILERLRAKLGISAQDAVDLERDALHEAAPA